MNQDKREIHQKLIVRARKGDQSAYYRLYKLYVQAIYNVCLRIVPNQLDAEDLVQETFISAFEKLKTFRGDASFGSWLKKIAVNKSLNFLRKKRIVFTDVEETKSHELGKDTEEDTENIFKTIAPEKVHEHIKKLPDRGRVVLNLYLLEEYKHKEIAEMLNISESTSKSQYQRAKELLKQSLKKEVDYEI